MWEDVIISFCLRSRKVFLTGGKCYGSATLLRELDGHGTNYAVIRQGWLGKEDWMLGGVD